MSDRITFHVTILWEHELREAARAIAKARALPETATAEEQEATGGHVLAACWTALRDLAEDPDGNMTVMACGPKGAPVAPSSGGAR